MHSQYFKAYSHCMGREMECKVYGHAGVPVLFIPCQDGRFFDFENYRMTDAWAPWIESGKVMVFAVDTVDQETWSDKGGDPYWRIRRYEQWIQFLVREMAPFMQDTVMAANGWESCPGIIPFGCSLGATHALNLFLRFPDVFGGVLALSGIYTAEYGFGDYMDEVVYQNSPVHFLPNLPADHPHIARYNEGTAILCASTGAWELPETTFRLKELFREKGINAWVDIWGSDCEHDWPWWYRQVAYFVPTLLGE